MVSGIVSLLVFVFSAVFHFLTFIPSIHVSGHQAWPLHTATIAVCAVMVFSLVAQRQRSGIQEFEVFHSKAIAPVPPPLRIAFVGLVNGSAM